LVYWRCDLRRITGFEWDRMNVAHIARHRVRPWEAEEAVLLGYPHFLKRGSDRYLAFGISGSGRFIFVVFVVASGGIARVITARDMTRKDISYYKKQRGER
jgi:uncharacterized DUF497 family protein